MTEINANIIFDSKNLVKNTTYSHSHTPKTNFTKILWPLGIYIENSATSKNGLQTYIYFLLSDYTRAHIQTHSFFFPGMRRWLLELLSKLQMEKKKKKITLKIRNEN